MIAGGIIIAASLAALIGFAAYPFFSGQGIREFFVSLPVPFLISLMGFVPGALLYFTGRRVLQNGAGVGAGIIAVVLALPPVIFGLWLLPKLGAQAPVIRTVCVLTGAIVLIWGISVLRAAIKGRQ